MDQRADDPERQEPEQPELLPGMVRATARAARRRRSPVSTPSPVAAGRLPVARVLVDVPLAHLDRPFDYEVPATMADGAVPGTRVKVRFAGTDVDGFVVGRSATSEHPGRLQPLRRLVSSEPVLAPRVAELTGEVAHRYAGTRSDVLRLAVPPRHARTEQEASAPAPAAPDPDPGCWAAYETGPALLRAWHAGRPARAVWSTAPGEDWPALLAEAALATYAGGRGALLCLPDGKDVARVDTALRDRLGEGHHAVLVADAGPAARYRAFLAVARGTRRIVIGTRAAAFAPVRDLGLVAIWDDGDDLYAEPRAPYPHTREVLLMRARLEGTGFLAAGHARTVEDEYLLRTGWAHPVQPARALLRDRVRVAVAGTDDRTVARDPGAGTRIPGEAHRMLRGALQQGPVLVQAPRSGYRASLACARCRAPARCPECSGPLQQPAAAAAPACRWCGREALDRRCPECGDHGLRAPVVGETRTAEELGRAHPQVPVRRSGGDHVLATVPGEPAVVVATPGAEPVADGGYAAVLLLDAWLPLARPELRAEEEALRRWLNAAALAAHGGRVLLVGPADAPAVQALVRWDPAGFAERELAQRQSAHLPPASRLAVLRGDPEALADAMALLTVPEGTEVLGPIPADADSGASMVLRTPRSLGEELSAALGEMQRLRSAKKLTAVRVQVDPLDP